MIANDTPVNPHSPSALVLESHVRDLHDGTMRLWPLGVCASIFDTFRRCTVTSNTQRETAPNTGESVIGTYVNTHSIDNLVWSHATALVHTCGSLNNSLIDNGICYTNKSHCSVQ